MHALHVLAVLSVALFANAEIYVTSPSSGATFTGGKPVTVEWIDNGAAPVLSDVGIVRVGLYTDGLKLVQSIVPVDVAKTHSFTFTPNPQAGPNSDQYYIAFVSTAGSYIGYSPNFGLNGMSGSFSSPNPAATSSIPIPSSLLSPTATASSTSTISASGTATGASGTSTSGAATGTSGASSGASGTSTTVASGSSSASLSEGTSSTLQTTATGASSSGRPFSSTTSTGFSSSSTGTASSTISTAVPTNAAVANGPATGFAWTLIVFLGFAIL